MKFTPSLPMQTVCDWKCAKALGDKKKAKAIAYAKREERKADREKRLQLMRLSDVAKLTEKAVNAYARKRDDGLPCISCGTTESWQWHAGHYLSVGSHPELRFNEDNINRQCFVCNSHKGGNQAQYRIGLIEKIGLERVEWLEGPHEAKKYTREELIEIKQRYSRMARELEKS